MRFRVAIPVVFLLLVGWAAAQGGNKNQSPLRSLQGQVMGHDETPLADAIVHLKNTRTLAVRSFITKADGQYQFNSLTPNVDYEVYAQDRNGRKSDTKTFSAFDSRAKARINLHIDTR